VILGIAAVVVVILAAAGIVFASGKTGPEAAIPACHERIKNGLRTAATAQFPGGETIEASETQTTIVGVFDAENTFGALTRYSYRCMLLRNDDGSYRIYDVTIR
jgi:hypothetical protein